MPQGTFTVTFTPQAPEDLEAVSDARSRQKIFDRAQELDHDPLQQGKPLGGPLKHYYSVRAAGQRYRIVYQVAVAAGSVTVVVVGIRKQGDKADAYAIADKRLK